jgi:hypothetical protein
LVTNQGIKFHENPSSGRRLVSSEKTAGQPDISDEAGSRFSQFMKEVNIKKKQRGKKQH